MNLLQLVDEPYDSGIVHYALTLAVGLKERGHRAIVGAPPKSFAIKEAARLGLEAFPVRRLPAGLLDLRRLIEDQHVELVDAHTGSSHTLAVAATSLMDTVVVVRTRADARPLRRSKAFELLLGKTAGFIAPTERILVEFKKAYPDSPVKSSALAPGITATNGTVAVPPSPPFRVGMLGRLDPVKGHDSFLRAAALVHSELPETRFAIAGREENVKLADLRALAHELGIENAVELLGHVPDAAAFMSGCHIGVIASIGSEAISRAAIEWMAASRPLIATSIGSLPELVDDGKTGYLVQHDSPKIMARRIVDLLKDPVLRVSMGSAAHERFQSHFSLARLAEQSELFYNSILLSSKGEKK